MKKISLIFCFLVFLFFCSATGTIQAQEKQNFDGQTFKAQVLEILEEQKITREDGSGTVLQKIKLKGLEAEFKDQEFIHDGTQVDVLSKNYYKKNDKVLVSVYEDLEGVQEFYIMDFVRTKQLWLLFVVFVLSLLLVGKWQGVRSLIGLGITFFIILYFIIPQILAGQNPLLITILGCLAMILITIYLTHGWSRKSHVTVFTMFLVMIFIGCLSVLFQNYLNLSGYISDESIYILQLAGGQLNLQGLLLAGILLGALGVLDDVVLAQVSTVNQIKKANLKLRAKEVYRKSMKVGVDHISSMTNTLFLAYAGAALPLLILFKVKQEPFVSLSQVFSNEMVVTEILRTLVGSVGLILAVPLATYLAVRFLKVKE